MVIFDLLFYQGLVHLRPERDVGVVDGEVSLILPLVVFFVVYLFDFRFSLLLRLPR